MVRRKWWRYQEGIFLVGMLAALTTAVLWLLKLYNQGQAGALRSNESHCDMSLILVMVAWLLILSMLPFCGWQASLVRRRLAGKPVTAWGVVAFLGSLLPFFYLGYMMLSV